jgi:hypothetical protein
MGRMADLLQMVEKTKHVYIKGFTCSEENSIGCTRQ